MKNPFRLDPKKWIALVRRRSHNLYLILFAINLANYYVRIRTILRMQKSKNVLVVAIVSDSSQVTVVSLTAAGILLCKALNFQNLTGLDRRLDALKVIMFNHLDPKSRQRYIAACEMETRKLMIIQSLGFMLLIFIDYVLYNMEGPNPIGWQIIFSIHLPAGHVINAFNIYFNSKLVLIGHFYRSLYEHMEPNCVWTTTQYSVFVLKQKYLQHATDHLNGCLVVQKLCIMLAYFTMTTADVYFLAYITLTNHKRYRNQLGPRLYRIFSIAACMSRIIFTIRLTERNKADAKTGILKSHLILMRDRKVMLKDKIISFSFQQLHFNNKGFFELNYSFLYDVIAAICMNIFFLLQFQVSIQ